MKLSTKLALKETLTSIWCIFPILAFYVGLAFIKMQNYEILGIFFIIASIYLIIDVINGFYWWESHYDKEWFRY